MSMEMRSHSHILELFYRIDEFYSVIANVEALEIDYYIKPRVRFKNSDGEQSTFFLKDPSGNYIEIKAFKNIDNLFKH